MKKNLGTARYVCLYCASEPKFGDGVVNYCEDCIFGAFAGDENSLKSLCRYNHTMEHPLVRCLFANPKNKY